MSNARKLVENSMPEDEGRKLAEFCLNPKECGGEPYQGWSNSSTWCFHQYFFQEGRLVDAWDALKKSGLDPQRVVRLFDNAQREGRMEAIDDWCEGKVNVLEIIDDERGSGEPNKGKYGRTKISPDDLPQKLESISEAGQKLVPGMRVKIAGGSGIDSDEEGVIVPRTEVKTDGAGVPSNSVQGHYKPVDWSREVAIRLDNGGLITMFKNRVIPITEASEHSEEADALVPKSDAVVKVEISGSANTVQRAISKMAKKGAKKAVAEAAGSIAPRFSELDSFAKAYVEAIFFTEGGPDHEEWSEKDFGDLAPETIRRIIADCKKFEDENGEAIAVGADRGSGEYSAWQQAGHDFWFTRNGHGVGFWDGDWPEPQASQLDKAAKSFGSADMYVGDDGLIYQMGAEEKRGPGVEFVTVKDNSEAKDSFSDDVGESTKTIVDRLIQEDEESESSEVESDPEQDYEDMKSDLESGEAATINAKGEVYFGRKVLGKVGREFEDQDQAFKALEAEAEKQHFFPNVYVVNDHGNVSLYTLSGEFVRDWV